MMDKRTILAFVIIALIVILWDDYLKWVGLAPPEEIPPTETIRDTQAPAKTGTGSFTPKTIADESAPPVGSESIIPPKAVQSAEFSSTGTDFPEKFITVETDWYRAKLTTHGAGLVSFVIKENGKYIPREIELIPHTGSPRPAFRFWTYAGPVDTDRLKFNLQDTDSINRKKLRIYPGKERKVTFVTYIADNRELEVIYTFKGDGYTFLYETNVSGNSDLWVRPEAEAYWRGGLAFTEPDTNQDTWYSKAYVYYSSDVIENLKVNSKKDVLEGPTTGTTRWGAVRTKYFMTALIPETVPAEGAWMESQFDSVYVGNHHPNRLGVGLKVPLVGNNPATPVRVYIGPLDDDILSRVDPSLKRAMTWGAGIPFLDGIISPISKVVLWGLKALHRGIPNYGLCIIIFSVLVKILIWPLTRKSYQSMAAMQRLQPKMKEIREKYKKDQQRAQREIMNLYKTEKVNPMGGCLPMLLQMPLLYALFIVFRATIEFRRAPFFLWIQDLSLPDKIIDLPFSLPLYGSHIAVLPIVMGVTSFFQSKSTITDPNQKMLLYFMPVFLTLIFNQFPSGLTLYYTLFNVLTLAQQRITKPPAAAVDPAAKS